MHMHWLKLDFIFYNYVMFFVMFYVCCFCHELKVNTMKLMEGTSTLHLQLLRKQTSTGSFTALQKHTDLRAHGFAHCTDW
jgi:hypothetical protein